MKKKKIGKAYEHIKVSLDLDPTNPRTLNSCGNILKKLSRFDEATNYFIKAIENSHTMGSNFFYIFLQFIKGRAYKSLLHFNLGSCLLLNEKFFFGLKELDRALVIDVKIGEIMMKKGLILLFFCEVIFF